MGFAKSSQGVIELGYFKEKSRAMRNVTKQKEKNKALQGAKEERTMSEPKDKRKFALWVREETMEKVEKLYRAENVKSRSEFIEKAINFYCGYLTASDGKEYFPQVIVATLQGALGAFENRMASLLFKMAVELSMSLHVTAANSEIDEETLIKLRGLCVDEVKRIHGTVSFDEAYKFQKG